jgi:hypothetical protein
MTDIRTTEEAKRRSEMEDRGILPEFLGWIAERVITFMKNMNAISLPEFTIIYSE